jgi:hypothetical protein
VAGAEDGGGGDGGHRVRREEDGSSCRARLVFSVVRGFRETAGRARETRRRSETGGMGRPVSRSFGVGRGRDAIPSMRGSREATRRARRERHPSHRAPPRAETRDHWKGASGGGGTGGDLGGETEGARAALDERGDGSIEGDVGPDVPCVRRYAALVVSRARFGPRRPTQSRKADKTKRFRVNLKRRVRGLEPSARPNRSTDEPSDSASNVAVFRPLERRSTVFFSAHENVYPRDSLFIRLARFIGSREMSWQSIARS